MNVIQFKDLRQCLGPYFHPASLIVWKTPVNHASTPRFSWSETAHGKSTNAYHAREAGFTLMELMVTLSVITIVGVIGIPPLMNIANNTRATALANEFIATFHVARSEAVRRGRPIVVCPATPSGRGNCGSNTWQNGWVICIDDTHGTAIPTCIGSNKLHVSDAPRGNPSFSVAGGPNWIRYLPHGGIEIDPQLRTSTENDNVRIEIDIAPRHCLGNQGRRISVNSAGRPSVMRVTCPG